MYWFRAILFTILIALIVFASFSWINRKSKMEKFLSQQLNATVSIENLSINFNELILQNISIVSNLKSTSSIKIHKIEAEFFIWNLFNKTLKIKNLRIFNPQLHFELSSQNQEFITFLNFLPAKEHKKFTIDNINLYSIEFEVFDASKKEIDIWPIPYISLTNIPENQSLSDLSQYIFHKIVPKMISKTPLPFKKESSPLSLNGPLDLHQIAHRG